MKRTFTISLTAIVFLSLIVILAITHTHSRVIEPKNNGLEEIDTLKNRADSCMTSHNYVEAIHLFNEIEKKYGLNARLEYVRMYWGRAEAYGALGLYEYVQSRI